MPLRVLVVDDDADHAESLADFIQLRGYDVGVVFDAETAIERCQRTRYDVVILDVRLPKMSGVEAFFELVKLNPQIKVLFITGYTDESIEAALKRGAIGVMMKPFAIDELFSIIEKLAPKAVALAGRPDCALLNALVMTAGEMNWTTTRTYDVDELCKIVSAGLDCAVVDCADGFVAEIGFPELFRKLHGIPVILLLSHEAELEGVTATSANILMLQKPVTADVVLAALKRTLQCEDA